MINIGEIVKLNDDKEYVVVDKLNLHNINYVYLVTNKKPIEVLIVTEGIKDGEISLKEIKDNNELEYILSQFALSAREID